MPTVPVKNLNGSSPVHPALAGKYTAKKKKRIITLFHKLICELILVHFKEFYCHPVNLLVFVVNLITE